MVTRLSYRPEIDGLRAIAVVSVVLYHLQINILNKFNVSGGFFGVDIFFVISGYLITRIIILNKDKKNFYLNFLNKRIKRLVPLIVFIFIIFIPVAYVFLLPLDLLDFSRSVLSALGLFSNIYFYLTQVEYGLDNLSKPMLHLWSLSIEKQYYIIFPLILLMLNRSKQIHKLFLVIILLNLLLMQFLGNLNFSKPFIEANFDLEAKTVFFNFFFISSRIWEFFLGSVAFFLENKKIIRKKINGLLIPYFGLCIIFFSIFYFNDRVFHPSFINLMPVLGAFLIILFLKKSNKFFILSSFPMVFIGKISYSIYLWHYPLICFSSYLEIDFTTNTYVFIYLSTLLIISIFSYFFIEKKFRYEDINNKKFYSYLSLVIFMIIASLTHIIKTKGAKYRVPEIFSKAVEDTTSLYNHRIYETSNSTNKVILVGDSHMKSLKFNLRKNLEKKNVNYAQSIFDGCQLIRNTQRVDKITLTPKLNCNIQIQEERIKFIKKHPNAIVIIGGRLPLILTEERFNNQEGGYEGKMNDFIQNKKKSLDTIKKRNEYIYNEYKNTILELANHNRRVIVLYPIPEVGWNLPRKLRKHLGLDLSNIDKNKIEKLINEKPITTNYSLFESRTRSSFELLDGITHKNIIRIYPHKVFCNVGIKGRCITHDSEDIYYYDNNHLSIKGSEKVNKMIMKEIENIVSNE